jgi:hypothetical protein
MVLSLRDIVHQVIFIFVVQRNKALYSDIAERLTKQAQFYLNAQGQGEERQILVNQIANFTASY